MRVNSSMVTNPVACTPKETCPRLPQVFPNWSKLTPTHTLYQVRDQFHRTDHVVTSHSPSGAPYAGITRCSFVGSPHCNAKNLLSFTSHAAPLRQPLMLILLPLSPWSVDTHIKKSSTGNNLQCSQSHVNAMAPRPRPLRATQCW